MALPKHAVIFQELERAIAKGRYKAGQRLPSDVTLASRYGVSRPTVAQALRELHRMGLLERRRGAGTSVRQTPAGGGTFGLIADGIAETELMGPLSSEIARLCAKAGSGALMDEPIANRSAEAIAEEWAARGVRGVWYAPIEHHPVREGFNRAIALALGRKGLPVVLLDRDLAEFPERSGYDLVATDDFAAGFELTSHLLERGCRRVLFVARPEYPSTTDLRLAGARAAVARWEGAVIEFVVGFPDDRPWVARMLRQTRSDAVVGSNDSTAADLMESLVFLGYQVPGKIRVGGFDDFRRARLLKPALTTMRQDHVALGAACLDAMLGRLRDPEMPARRILLRARLIPRASTR